MCQGPNFWYLKHVTPLTLNWLNWELAHQIVPLPPTAPEKFPVFPELSGTHVSYFYLLRSLPLKEPNASYSKFYKPLWGGGFSLALRPSPGLNRAKGLNLIDHTVCQCGGMYLFRLSGIWHGAEFMYILPLPMLNILSAISPNVSLFLYFWTCRKLNYVRTKSAFQFSWQRLISASGNRVFSFSFFLPIILCFSGFSVCIFSPWIWHCEVAKFFQIWGPMPS